MPSLLGSPLLPLSFFFPTASRSLLRFSALLSSLGFVAAGCADPAEDASRADELSSRPMYVARRVDDAITVDGAIDPAWDAAERTTFATNWAGQATPIETSVRILHRRDALYMLWELTGAGLRVDESHPTDVERANLYEEDCVEIFLTPDPSEPKRYFEIELGPLGHWFDLLVDRRDGNRDDLAWSSEIETRTSVDRASGRVVIEAAIRSPEVLAALRPGAELPLALYRIEGRGPRNYLAWSPTESPRPNFHVPEKFGRLRID